MCKEGHAAVSATGSCTSFERRWIENGSIVLQYITDSLIDWSMLTIGFRYTDVCRK